MAEIFRLFIKALDRATWISLSEGSSTVLSVVFIAIGGIVAAWVFTAFVSGIAGGKMSFRDALKSWQPYIGAILGAVFVWSVLIVWHLPGVITSAYAGHIRTIRSQSVDVVTLTNQLSAKPKVITRTVAQDNPALMTPGVMLSMVADIRSALRDHAPIEFAISAPAENYWVRDEFNAILTEACNRTNISKVPCNIGFMGRGLAPQATQQGITVHVSEKPVVDKSPATGIGMLAEVLGKWYTIHESLKFPEAMKIAYADQMRTEEFIWIEIGPGAPWKNADVRLRNGITAAQIEKLGGWDVSLKKRLLNTADDLASISTHSPYRQILAETIIVLRDAGKQRLSTGAMQQMAVDLLESDYKAPGGAVFGVYPWADLSKLSNYLKGLSSEVN